MNKLLPCLNDVFIVIDELEQLQENKFYPPHEIAAKCGEIKKKTLNALIQFELLASAQQIDAMIINKSKFAVVAFIDELAVSIFSSTTSSWISAPLQLEIFKEINAGEIFFTHLSEVRLKANQYIDVLEIYYLFIELGYKGQYRPKASHLLLNLKTELLSQIQHIRNIPSWDLLIQEYKNNNTLKPKKSLYSLNNILIGAVSSLVIYGIVLISTINYQATQYSKEIEHNQHLYAKKSIMEK